MADTQTEIQAKVKRVLQGTPFSPESLKQLSGGTANFIYHAVLEKPLPEYPHGVVVKQGEAYVATNPSFPLATSRCAIEQQCLAHLAELPAASTASSSISTPAVYHFNQESNTQVQEYLVNAVSLKAFALEHYAAPTPVSLKPQCQQLGHGLGAWLRSFHSWSEQPEQADLREKLAGNKEMQSLKNMVNYKQLVQMADRHPTILGDVKSDLQDICNMTATELVDEAALYVIHGDFWTGNVLLPNEAIQEGAQTPVRIIDWELAQLGVRPLDLGQMIAELWQLKLYKDIDAGDWLIEAFAGGYGSLSSDDAFRAIIHVGVHLICFGSRTPGWGTPEQGVELVETGKEVLLKAWGKDREWFKGHVLGSLFSTSH
ncbi:kinase-like domain-containing protein [Ilyonectria robusta]|uniref:kinase-like domain-containing protein n=1 Tax=Ilyonectria robusta TaxID=1079257 RepID=UPI001E8D1AC8|nr:kinase-like domain-containing protein [Ilyonectria robusta]KAH8686692.1 kinase-like domain-containing protein [Ilyonectria robusta]